MQENEFLDDISKYNQLLRVAKMYYEQNISQEEISVLENTSKATVSRMLQKAKSMGIVTFSINYPIESVYALEEKIKHMFGIKSVFVVPVYVDDYKLILKDVCKTLAADLSRIVKDGDIIGISWGRTMDALSDNLNGGGNAKDLKIVQLNGSLASNVNSSRSSTILVKFAYAFDAMAFQLPAPLVVDTIRIRSCLLEDSQIRRVMDMVDAARIAVFSVGRLSKESILFESGSIGAEYYDQLRKQNAVGDICAHYFNIKGELIETDLEQRILGVTYDSLLNKEHRIAIAVGKEKARSVAGALRGNFITSLYIDEIAARELLTIS